MREKQWVPTLRFIDVDEEAMIVLPATQIEALCASQDWRKPRPGDDEWLVFVRCPGGKVYYLALNMHRDAAENMVQDLGGALWNSSDWIVNVGDFFPEEGE